MVTRISGLASGMDVDTIVKGLMDAERMPLDKLYQKKTYTEWQRDDYRTMNTALSELDTLIFKGIGLQSSFNKKTVTVSDENSVSVKNVSSTSNFSGTIKDVTQLASAARLVSGTTTITSATKTLKEIDPSFVDQTIAIKAINKYGGFDQVTKKNPDGTSVIGADGKEVKIDKVYTLAIKATDTVESVINKINADSGVTVFFDEGTKQFSITAKNTGNAKDSTGNDVVPEIFIGASDSDNNGTVDGTSDFFTNILNIAAANSDDTINGGTAGVNASLTYNGLTIERASNAFMINGAEITLKKETAGPVTFSSTADVDTIYNTIKSFVDSYNGLIANISGKLSEKKDSSYAPLTDAQKKDMKDTDITLWEAKAKKGTLRKDSTLSSLLTKMRTSIYTSVDNTYFGDLSKIGITTTKDYTAGGKLEIKEETLRAAIAEDPNGIYNLFMANGEKTVDGKTTTIFSENGVARRLRADLKSAMTDISTKAGTASAVNNTFTLGRLLDNYTDKISSFEDRMASLETRYYKQFTAMEKAIQNANSQSASLSSFLGN